MDKPDRQAADLKRKVDELERLVRIQENQIRFLERERQKLSALVNHTDAGFVIVNSHYQLAWTNNAFRDRFISSDIDCASQTVSCRELVCSRGDICEACPVDRAMRTGKVTHHEIHAEVAGKAKHIYLTAMPIKSPEGNADEALVMFQDVTDL
jgi:hypothetical protein